MSLHIHVVCTSNHYTGIVETLLIACYFFYCLFIYTADGGPIRKAIKDYLWCNLVKHTFLTNVLLLLVLYLLSGQAQFPFFICIPWIKAIESKHIGY